ncbi:hypothetical protein E5F05_11310 [Deinococcus metallilatus]|uniref:Uncharacterized protein n=1 Tax=Deinococcus metallilatus TaxID=1211322 RepID=A0AAJ5F399_9DEIO|nr:hypothetical protein [Deinococcus metallilatus]MBB5296492.1 hypothetical protein [Deinococcus metallilatus]QBY08475.1 hypothetical protein E5F05_11310 [Deinococcus metallilatus]RXJ11274.1 hypothetical protein ERJ73_10130 [Deinococcus metallilatus]TLK24765.1 hypothetical protein FCS05_14565 [Deinococcus metallilatus]GMA17409.1 hypothetical protein GCM10025871_37400 [Deinococcus metallilatus]
MSVFVYFETDNYDNHYQFSNLNFTAILGVAEGSDVSSELLRLLNEGALMHAVCIENYSIDTQTEFISFMQDFLKYVKTKTSDMSYLNHIESFVKILTDRKQDLKTNFTYLDEGERFQL